MKKQKMSDFTNKSSDNQNNNNLLKLYPFNGRSPYLIDKFYIIGYNYLTLHKLLIENTPKDLDEESKDFRKFNIDEEPCILNEITSDYNKVGLPNETLLKMIYPKKVDFYYKVSENNFFNVRKSNKIPQSINNNNEFCKIEFKKNPKFVKNFIKSYKTFFSSNPQSENNSKKSINGIAYTFYKKFLEKKIIDKRKYIYYIPYTFCIVSEYPYFNSFYKLCKCIKKLYNQEPIYIPIEFLINNIIVLTPSPINSDIVLDLKSLGDQGSLFGNYNQAISNICSSSQKQLIDFSDTIMPMSNFNTNDDLKNLNGIKSLKASGFVFVGENNYKNISNVSQRTSTTIFQKSNSSTINLNKEEFSFIKFKFLSGYPLIQYNLSKVLFYNLTPEKVITIFLYTFLEKDVLFFSKDIEYLTLTLNAYLNLNFPLNDEKYYFIGAAISFEDFYYGISEFALKNYTSIIGINDQYRADYKNKSLKIQDHLAIDLDKGEINFGIDENNDKINENNKKLTKLIKKVCEEKDDTTITNNILHQSIKNLSLRLKKIYENINDSFSKTNNEKFLDYDDVNDKNNFTIYARNREIQEAFYEFIHNVCLYFYENLSIKTFSDQNYSSRSTIRNDKNDENEMNVIFNINENEVVMCEEEKIFLSELTDTMKFQSFVFVFLQSYNPIDLYKIPLTFTEEFLSIISRKKQDILGKNYKISFFDLIDSLYNANKKTDDKKTITFDVTNFNYFKLIKNRFDREIYDKSRTNYLYDKRNLIKFISGKTNMIMNQKTGNQRVLIYQTYELDDSLLLKYINFYQNLSEKEFNSSFYGSFFVKENILNSIYLNDIETRIENYCISRQLLSISDVCCANIILLFTISLKALRKAEKDNISIGIFFQEFTIFRKYYSVLLRIIYKLYKDEKSKSQLICYYPTINSIRVNKLVPNEYLMNMIHQFNKIDIFNFSAEEPKKNETNDDDMFEDIELYGKQLEEEPITNDNLYVYNNYTHNRFVKEKEIVDIVNKSNLSHLPEIYLKTKEAITPRIRFNDGKNKYETFFMDQKSLLDQLTNEYNKYIDNLDDSKVAPNIILNACLNIFIYMRNNDEFRDKDDLILILQNIFYIYMNQLSIKKSTIEKK